MDKKYVLLLGEGNFSFAASLSSNADLPYVIIATDFKPSPFPSSTWDALTLKNIHTIESNSGLVFTNLDATKIKDHLGIQKYKDSITKIVFNFPHVQTKKMQLGANRDFLKRFFISVGQFINDKVNISDTNIPIVVSLCCGQSGINEIEVKHRIWADSWQIIEQAAYGNFVLRKVQKFRTDESSYKNSGYRDRTYASFNAENANAFTFEIRETLLPPGDHNITEENRKTCLETLQTLDFLENLQDSNPLRQLIKRVIPKNLSLRLEIDYGAVESPFFDIYVDNLGVDSTLEALNFLEVDYITGTIVVKCDIDTVGVFDGKHSKLKKILSLNLTKILRIINRIDDCRILYSKYCCKDLDNPNGKADFSTGSLYPREHTFDVSFWIIGPNFSYKSLLHCALMVYGLLLKSIKLIEVYEPTVNTTNNDNVNSSHKMSHCYRLIVGSTDLGMSRIKADEFQIGFRQVLRNKLDIELR